MLIAIRAPRSKALEMQKEIEDLKKPFRAVVGTELSPSQVVFFIDRMSIDYSLWLLDYFKQSYAYTSKGILRRNGDHLITEYPQPLTLNDSSDFLLAWLEKTQKRMMSNETINTMVNSAAYGV